MSTVIKSFYIGILILILGFAIAFSESHVVTETLEFVISDDGTGELKVKRLVRVEDERGKSLGKVQFQDNRYTDTKNIEARLLDQNKKIVKKLKKKDIEQYKGAASYGAYVDYTFLAFELSSTSLPYYIEYSYVKEYRSLFFWRHWLPESDFLVKESIYRLTVPKNFQYRTQRIGGEIDSTYDPKGNTVTWKLTDIPAFEDEYKMCPEDEDRFGIQFVPLTFELDNISGSFESWDNFGTWYRNLSGGVYDLKDESLAEIRLPEFSNAREIVSTAFRYIQEKTHYVLINPGIHGWKPHSAQSIFDNKYGDCKDLATFLIAILRKRQIPAYPALVLTRNCGVVDKNFPSNDFNHLIAYVPLRNDTLWLDCTSEYNTPENIPDMDEGAGALIIFDDRVQLTKIPVSSPERNQTLFKANIVIDEEGTAKVSGKYTATGDDDINLKEIFLSKDDEERRKTIINWLIEFSPNLTLESLSFANLENIHASTVIEFDCTARHYAELTRNRLFFNPNFFHRVIFKSEKPSERKSAVYYSYPFVCNDTITFVVPEKFLPESVRDTVSLCQSFGSFETKAVFSGGQVVYTRKRSINQKKIDFSDYGAYYDFMEKIEKLDAAKMVFRK